MYRYVMVIEMKKTVRIDIEYDTEELGIQNVITNIESINCKVIRFTWV